MQLAILDRPNDELTANLVYGTEQRPVDLDAKLLCYTDEPNFQNADLATSLRKKVWMRTGYLGRFDPPPTYFLLLSSQEGNNCWDFNHSLFQVVDVQTEKSGTLYLAELVYEGCVRFSLLDGKLQPWISSNGNTPELDVNNVWTDRFILICHINIFPPSFYEFLGQPGLDSNLLLKAIHDKI